MTNLVSLQTFHFLPIIIN